MSAASKRRGPAGVAGEAVLIWTVLAVVVAGLALLTAAMHLAVALDGGHEQLPAHPVTLLGDLAHGRLEWPRYATVVLIVLVVAATALAAGAAMLVRRARRRGGRVDRAAAYMGRGRDLGALERRGATATAKRLGVDAPGLTIGRTVAGGRTLYQGWKETSLDIAGPRVGKTTARVIPPILEAPGAVVATSNKRDVVDATRGPRSAAGPVRVFDPQGLVDEPRAGGGTRSAT